MYIYIYTITYIYIYVYIPFARSTHSLLLAMFDTCPVRLPFIALRPRSAVRSKAGGTNKTLVMRSIRPDGLILQPSKPARPRIVHAYIYIYIYRDR